MYDEGIFFRCRAPRGPMGMNQAPGLLIDVAHLMLLIDTSMLAMKPIDFAPKSQNEDL